MKKIFIIILVSFTLIPTLSRAVDTYTLLEPLPCIEGVGGCKPGTVQTDIDINNYILYIYKFSIALAVFLAIVMIIWGGFEYITSEIPFIKSDGKSKIQNAVTGLVMVLVSYLILGTIDPRLVNINSNIDPIRFDKNQLDEIARYQNQTTVDFESINAENQIKFIEMNKDIKELQAQRAAVDSKLKNGEIATPEEAELRKKGLDAELTDALSNRNVLLAENTGLGSFATAMKAIHNYDGRADSYEQYTAEPIKDITSGRTPRPTNSNNVIQNQYNEKINDIIKSNTNFDSIQVLEKQRDFFIAQVKVEASIEINAAHKDTDLLNITRLEAKLDLNSKPKLEMSGLSKENYTKIMQARIDTIDTKIAELNTKK